MFSKGLIICSLLALFKLSYASNTFHLLSSKRHEFFDKEIDFTSHNGMRAIRQTDSESEEDNIMCTIAFRTARCTVNSYTQRLVNAYTQCGQYYEAYFLYDDCTRRENGEFCIHPTRGLDNLPVVAAYDLCESSFTNLTCSSRCQFALQSIKRNLGCCINSLYNISEAILNSDVGFNNTIQRPTQFRRLFEANLWSRCDVETAGTCTNDAEISVLDSDEVCSREKFTRLFSNHTCNQTNIQPVLNSIRRESESCYTSTIESLIEFCEERSDGENCRVVSSLSMNGTNIVNQECDRNSENCSSSCREALVNFDGEYECCVNNLNRSTFNNPATDDRVWNRCGVELRDPCFSSLVAGAGSVHASIVIVMLVLIVQLL